MFFLGVPMFVDPETARAERRYDYHVAEARRKDPVDWDPDMKFDPALHIKASTYQMPSIFDVKPSGDGERRPRPEKYPDKHAVSPCGQWIYRERILEAGASLATKSGNRSGVVIFDGPVKIPMIHSKGRDELWNLDPWMSFTPMEFFTLRPGTRMARGHTIIAGLGLGHQLVEVCKKHNVKKVTLIEKDQGIVDWILPRLDLNGKDLEVVVGNAKELLFDMKADVALVDIYRSYGGNGRDLRFKHFQGKMPGVKKLWVWGAA